MADNNKIYTAEKYKYFAFISYNSKDKAWGKRLQKKLEGYRMPATLCSEHGWSRKTIKPVSLTRQTFSQHRWMKS